MAIDKATVVKVARLARIAVSDREVEALGGELNTILGFVEQLNEVDVTGVEPMTAVVHMAMKKRSDRVTEGDKVEGILANAPVREGPFFAVPKVVE
jgi:aspartyl-tRNA(Asn)/glutamyl-tRNA(Gln) amidotransferase subunit C